MPPPPPGPPPLRQPRPRGPEGHGCGAWDQSHRGGNAGGRRDVAPLGRRTDSDTQEATFDFGDTKVVWTHRSWGSSPDPKYPWAAFFYGDKGTLKASVNGYEFFPEGKDKATLSGEPLFEYDKYPEDKTEKDLERHVASAVRWHMKNLLERTADRGRPVADIEEGYMSTTSCILANLAMKLGRTLAWDPGKMQVTGDAEATAMLKRPYRGPWTHPADKA